MRHRKRGLAAGAAAALLLGGLSAGCSSVKPCMVIPAQVELARDLRDEARTAMEEKRREADRWTVSIDQSRTRIARLTEERDQLRREVSGSQGEGKGK